MPKLEVTHPDGTQISNELLDDLVTVGRLADNTIQIEHASVSSHHAQLTLQNGKYRLQDFGSTNGTYINGEQVTDRVLKNADVVRFGQIESVYLTGEQVSASDALPLPEKEEAPVAVAKSSEKPIGFANASPFRTSKKKKDPKALAILSFTGLSIAIFAGAVYGILSLHQPGQ